MAVKYVLIGAMVLIGLFAFAKRDFVLDAFQWDPQSEGIPIPAFDPVARAQQLATPPPSSNALRVAQAPDVRGAVLPGMHYDDGATTGPADGGYRRPVRHGGRPLRRRPQRDRARRAPRRRPGRRDRPDHRRQRRVRAPQRPRRPLPGAGLAGAGAGAARLRCRLRGGRRGSRFSLEVTAPSGPQRRRRLVAVAAGSLGGSPSVSVDGDRAVRDRLGPGRPARQRRAAGHALHGAARWPVAARHATDSGGGASFGLRCAGVGPATRLADRRQLRAEPRPPGLRAPADHHHDRPPPTTVPGQPAAPAQPAPAPAPAPTPRPAGLGRASRVPLVAATTPPAPPARHPIAPAGRRRSC